MSGSGRHRVLIAGSGVAGIEAALALADLAGDRVEVELADPRREFAFRPFAVGEPYGASRGFRYDMATLASRCGATHLPSGVASIDPERRLALTRDDKRVPYDSLVVASGVRMLWAVPGAVTFWGVSDEGQVGDVVSDLRSGALDRVVFTMPGGHSWALPLYELALLAASEVRKAGIATGIVVVTPEDAPLEVFGRSVAEQTTALLAERGVELIAGTHPVKFEEGRLTVAPGSEVEASAVISLPRLEGRRIGGVPHDSEGFVGVDEHCRVIGLEDVYAAGDVTSFPVKQGGIASQQSDVAAAAIAAAAGASLDPRPFEPLLRGVLWTGGEPRYLYGWPGGGHGESSSFSEAPRGPLQGGKVTARYFSPLVDALEAEADPAGEGEEPLRRMGSAG